jgi:hypothetical protein
MAKKKPEEAYHSTWGPVVTQRHDFHLTLSQKATLDAWCKWYSARLDRINAGAEEDYTGHEQDLFEAFGGKK